jgi:exodeoxyribonuclease VII large subunit
MKLQIEDVDTAFTIGQIEIRRREIIEQLRKDGLLERNRQLSLSPVLQKIAVISSSGAAGLQDFTKQLKHNRFGYAFDVRLYESAVQGTQVEQNVTDRIAEVEESGNFDCIAIIRGGGSRIDLAAFDSYAIASAMARCRIPVLIGIGHDIDQTVLDLACHTSLKTPTAVAEFLIQHNMHFEEAMNELGMRIRTESERLMEKHGNFILRAAEMLKYLPARHIHAHLQKLGYQQERLLQGVSMRIEKEKHSLEVVREKLILLDPVQVLKKGYSITTVNGRVLRRAQDVREGDQVLTTLQEGNIVSEVKKIING